MHFARRRGIFKKILKRRLAYADIDLIFIRLEKNANEVSWKIIIEHCGEPQIFRSKLYENEKPFALKVLKDLVRDLKLWKEQLERS